MSEEWLTPDVRNALPEGYADEPVLQTAKDVVGLAKTVVDLKRYQGQSLRIPTKDASQESWDEFHAKVAEKVPGYARIDTNDPSAMKSLRTALGVPKEASDYAPSAEKYGAEGLYDENRAGEFAAAAHELGLTQDQFDGVLNRYFNWMKAGVEEQQSASKARADVLKAEWGQAYEANLADAAALLNRFGGVDQTEALQLVSEADPALAKTYATLANEFREKGHGNLPPARPRGEMTPNEAQSQLNDIMGNREHPYFQRAHPGHKAAIDQVNRLNQVLAAAET